MDIPTSSPETLEAAQLPGGLLEDCRTVQGGG